MTELEQNIVERTINLLYNKNIDKLLQSLSTENSKYIYKWMRIIINIYKNKRLLQKHLDRMFYIKFCSNSYFTELECSFASIFSDSNFILLCCQIQDKNIDNIKSLQRDYEFSNRIFEDNYQTLYTSFDSFYSPIIFENTKELLNDHKYGYFYKECYKTKYLVVEKPRGETFESFISCKLGKLEHDDIKVKQIRSILCQISAIILFRGYNYTIYPDMLTCEKTTLETITYRYYKDIYVIKTYGYKVKVNPYIVSKYDEFLKEDVETNNFYTFLYLTYRDEFMSFANLLNYDDRTIKDEKQILQKIAIKNSDIIVRQPFYMNYHIDKYNKEKQQEQTEVMVIKSLIDEKSTSFHNMIILFKDYSEEDVKIYNRYLDITFKDIFGSCKDVDQVKQSVFFKGILKDVDEISFGLEVNIEYSFPSLNRIKILRSFLNKVEKVNKNINLNMLKNKEIYDYLSSYYEYNVKNIVEKLYGNEPVNEVQV